MSAISYFQVTLIICTDIINNLFVPNIEYVKKKSHDLFMRSEVEYDLHVSTPLWTLFRHFAMHHFVIEMCTVWMLYE